MSKINDQTDENIINIEKIKEELESIRIKRMEGVAIRKKSQWVDKGEKATRYFCKLESRNYTNKTVSFLGKQNGEIIHNQKDILTEVTDFYSNLYKVENVRDVNLDDVITDAQKLNQQEIDGLEGLLTYQEAAKTL